MRFVRFACAFAVVAGWPLAAQQQPPQFRAATDTVDVHATVKLRNGAIADDLKREDFVLLEDGKEREISIFSKSIQPLSVSLVLDHSGSTTGEFENVRLAAQEFVGHLLMGDRAAVSTLTWNCQSFTSDPRDMLTVLRMELPIDYGSPVWAAADRAMSELAGETNRRVILLFSDGEDNQTVKARPLGPPLPSTPPASIVDAPTANSLSPCRQTLPEDVRTITDVMQRSERDAVMVYAVSVDTNGIIDKGPENLSKLARQSGASYQRMGKYSELKNAFRSIGDELHLQYLLGFVPAASDGKRHDIEVRVKRPGVTVQARKGYVAQSGR